MDGKPKSPGIGVFLHGLIATPILGMLNGFVLSQLWAWFVVPLGAQPIGVAHAMGLGVLVGLFLSSLHVSAARTKKTDKEAHETLLYASCYSVIYALFAWGWGALYHRFM